MLVTLRPANSDDSFILKLWDLDEAVGDSGDEDDNYDWDYELPRLVSWREFLIAEVDGHPIGAIVLISTLDEESHYWGVDVPDNCWAIDIWIGLADYLSRGFGTEIMKQALARCFDVHGVSQVLIDPFHVLFGRALIRNSLRVFDASDYQ